jgi:hypothetical protein
MNAEEDDFCFHIITQDPDVGKSSPTIKQTLSPTDSMAFAESPLAPSTFISDSIHVRKGKAALTTASSNKLLNPVPFACSR